MSHISKLRSKIDSRPATAFVCTSLRVQDTVYSELMHLSPRLPVSPFCCGHAASSVTLLPPIQLLIGKTRKCGFPNSMLRYGENAAARNHLSN